MYMNGLKLTAAGLVLGAAGAAAWRRQWRRCSTGSSRSTSRRFRRWVRSCSSHPALAVLIPAARAARLNPAAMLRG
jgi:hypothetical protein